jgi:hypothetical protein
VIAAAATSAYSASLPINHRYCGDRVGFDAKAFSSGKNEADCPFSAVEKAGKNSWRVTATCNDGLAFSAAIILSADGRSATMTNADGSAQTLTRCD